MSKYSNHEPSIEEMLDWYEGEYTPQMVSGSGITPGTHEAKSLCLSGRRSQLYAMAKK